jgi:hypothetical protein
VLNSAGDTSMQRLSAGQGTRGADETFEDTLRHRAELSDVYTQSMGFRTVVAKADEPALLLFQGVPDQFVEAESQVSLIVPADAFAHTQAKETIRLAAMLQDGRPLPSWIQFDGQSGKFTGEVPKGLAGELRVKVIARDTAGREAAALFRVNLGASRTAAGEPRAPAGRPGLSQQLRDTRSASAKAAPAQAQHK